MTGKLSLLLAATLMTSFTAAQDDEQDAPLPAAIKAPTTKPTTRPAAQLAKVTPDVQAVLDRINEAYARLTSLELSGTISMSVQEGNSRRAHEAKFASSFLAPNKYRHQVKDHPLLGGTGAKWYGYSPLNNLYTQADAQPGKALLHDMPEDQAKVLEQEDPSLILAISKDPSIDLRELASSITKLADENIDGKNHITLSLTLNDANKGPLTLNFDSQTYLLRRASLNMEDAFEKAGRADITDALYRVDYTTIKPNGALKADQFAWMPPSGSKDMAVAKAEALAAADEEAGPAAALVGKPSSDFTLDDMEGKKVTLSEMKGSVVVLDFWATWCGPCVAALPHLNKIYKEFEKDGLKVYALNQREDKQKVADFITNKNLTIPVLLDKEGNVAKQYLVTGIPQTVVIGKDGVVKKVIVGFNPDGDQEMHDLIAQELKAK
jgi:peroxiredoxin